MERENDAFYIKEIIEVDQLFEYSNICPEEIIQGRIYGLGGEIKAVVIKPEHVVVAKLVFKQLPTITAELIAMIINNKSL